LKSNFTTISQELSPYSQRDLAAKSCPAHNFVIWSQISKFFHRNDHNIETMCRVQNLGCYLEGQGHSMTLQQNRVWPKTLLFEVGFYNYFWQTTSPCPIPIRGALPGSDWLLFFCFGGVVIYFLPINTLFTWNFAVPFAMLIHFVNLTYSDICDKL